MTVRTEANIRGGNIKKLKIKSGPSENKKKDFTTLQGLLTASITVLYTLKSI